MLDIALKPELTDQLLPVGHTESYPDTSQNYLQ